MARLIKTFADGSILEYARGGFDDWCVYLTDPAGNRYPPKDTGYFADLRRFANKYSSKAIYEDFVELYDQTNEEVDPAVFRLIERLARKYRSDSLEIEIIYTILYASMIAEENKQYSRLGKKIKRLGIHQVLFDGLSVAEAANFSKGKNWRLLDSECKKRGF